MLTQTHADCILLAEYADYNTYEPKPIQHIKQMTMGYSGCIAAFKMADRSNIVRIPGGAKSGSRRKKRI